MRNSPHRCRIRIDTTPETLLALPSLEALKVRPEIVEAAADLLGSSEGPGVEQSRIELVVRLIAYHLPRRP